VGRHRRHLMDTDGGCGLRLRVWVRLSLVMARSLMAGVRDHAFMGGQTAERSHHRAETGRLGLLAELGTLGPAISKFLVFYKSGSTPIS